MYQHTSIEFHGKIYGFPWFSMVKIDGKIHGSPVENAWGPTSCCRPRIDLLSWRKVNAKFWRTNCWPWRLRRERCGYCWAVVMYVMYVMWCDVVFGFLDSWILGWLVIMKKAVFSCFRTWNHGGTRHRHQERPGSGRVLLSDFYRPALHQAARCEQNIICFFPHLPGEGC